MSLEPNYREYINWSLRRSNGGGSLVGDAVRAKAARALGLIASLVRAQALEVIALEVREGFDGEIWITWNRCARRLDLHITTDGLLWVQVERIDPDRRKVTTERADPSMAGFADKLAWLYGTEERTP